MNEFCGCGRQVKYKLSTDERGACNKYMRCPSYDEIKNNNFILRHYKVALERIADSGAGYYETLAYEAISNIKLFEKFIGEEDESLL